MKRRLFLTGAMGCGKSTAIRRGLGEDLPGLGGFLTERVRDKDEQVIYFTLSDAEGKRSDTFLDVSGSAPQIRWEAFSGLGRELLRGDALVLDEIGGVELLCPKFAAALEALLESDVPVVGVYKSESACAALVRKLGLTAEYEAAAARLRDLLRTDGDTLLYECGQYDETAPLLVEAWAKEYIP